MPLQKKNISFYSASWFLPRDATHNAAYAVVRCLCVRHVRELCQN